MMETDTQETIEKKFAELSEKFGYFEKTKDLVDNLIDIILN
jgi:hypothetical protein